jgi:hypothetical protein
VHGARQVFLGPFVAQAQLVAFLAPGLGRARRLACASLPLSLAFSRAMRAFSSSSRVRASPPCGPIVSAGEMPPAAAAARFDAPAGAGPVAVAGLAVDAAFIDGLGVRRHGGRQQARRE